MADQRARRRRPIPLDRVAARCNAPRRYVRLELEDMDDGGDAAYGAALARLLALGRDDLATGRFLERPRFLQLAGPFGTGKTRAATWLLVQACLGVRRRPRGVTSGWTGASLLPYFARAAELNDYRFVGFGRGDDGGDQRESVRERIFRTPFLVLDDLGRLAGNRGEEAFVERVVEERFDAELSTVITSNVKPTVAGEAPDGLPARFADFLRQFECVPLVGPSRREDGAWD